MIRRSSPAQIRARTIAATLARGKTPADLLLAILAAGGKLHTDCAPVVIRHAGLAGIGDTLTAAADDWRRRAAQ